MDFVYKGGIHIIAGVSPCLTLHPSDPTCVSKPTTYRRKQPARAGTGSLEALFYGFLRKLAGSSSQLQAKTLFLCLLYR